MVILVTAISVENISHFDGEQAVILVINLTVILALQQSFWSKNGHFRTGQRSFWKTMVILVITPKVGVELVINQLVKLSVSFLPVSDLPLSNQPLS